MVSRATARSFPWSRFVSSLLALAATTLAAQPHESHDNGYTLRSSTVRSTTLDPATAKAHGITPAADRAVLNVVVQRQDGPAIGNNVPAQVHATARNLTGLDREIPLRAATAPNGETSYVGTYDFASREVLDFRIRARPLDADTRLELRYRERMPALRD
jgi:hypothetical protein